MPLHALGRLVTVLAVPAALLCASPAAATTIDAGVLQVTSTPSGGLQATRDGRQMFSTWDASPGLFVRFADGPMANRLTGPGWEADSQWSAGTESLPMRSGETQTAVTTYTAGYGTAAVLRVRQIIRATDHGRSFRVTYRLENLTDAPLRFRAMSAGVVASSGLRGTVDAAASARAILPESAAGDQIGMEEVTSSRIAGDAAAVPVPAWAAQRSGDWYSIRAGLRAEDGPVTDLATGTGVIAAWDDHQAPDAGLAAGETARYEVVWHVRRFARLAVLNHPAHRWVGAQTATDLRVTDQAGEPVEGARVRWTVTGRHPTSTPGSALTGGDGRARIAYEGTGSGTDSITAWEDADDDGVLDADEPQRSVQVNWSTAPSPLSVTSNWQSPRVGETHGLMASLFDYRSGTPLSGAATIWSVSGANARAAVVRRSGPSGGVAFSYTGTQSGTDTVRVVLDSDDDGVHDTGEPVEERTVTWRQAAPPPVTGQILDGDGMDVTAYSNGTLAATFDDAPGSPLLRSHSTGVQVKILDGTLAGRSFGSTGYESGTIEPFHSDPQAAATRAGDVVTQTSSWRVRSSGVDVLRIHQTARLTDGRDDLRLTWRVDNLTDTAIRLRFGHFGDVIVDGNDTGEPVSSDAPRFVGLTGQTGFAAGLEEVRSSRLAGDAAPVAVPAWSGNAISSAWSIPSALAYDGLGAEVRDGRDAVGAQWSDRAAAGLTAGADSRYEVLWRMRRPMELTLTPPVDVAETRHEHRVTALLIDDAELPRADVALRYEIVGQHPSSGRLTTAASGQAQIAWTGKHVGRDVLTLYADLDDDATRDADEPVRSATVDWRRESAVDPPVLAPLRAPDGSLVSLNQQTNANGFTIALQPYQAALFPRCDDGSPKVGLRLSLNVNPGLGRIVPGSMSLRTVSTTTGDVEHPLATTPPTGPPDGERWSFVLECLPTASFVLCYDLEEGDEPVARFCITLGRVGVYDPSGVIFDRTQFDTLRAGGCPAATARRATALTGASVLLERKTADGFRRVLSGDPFVTPNVNPYVTEAGGRFGWFVSEGTYRVVVSADGFQTTTSREAVVPPADVELHVGLRPTGTPAAPTAAMQAMCDGAEPDPGTIPPDELPVPDPPPAADPAPQTPGDPVRQSGPSEASPDPAPGLMTSPAWLPSGWMLAPLPMPRVPLPRVPLSKAAPKQKAAPAARLRVHAEGLKVDREGRVRLRLVCPKGPAPCAGKIVLVLVDGNVVIARKGYRVAAGKRSSLRLKLGAASRASAKRSKRKIRVDVAQDGQRVTLGVVRVRR